MPATIGDLVVRIGANAEPLTKGLKRAKKEVRQLGADARSQGKDIAKIGAIASAAGAAFLVMAGNAAKSAKEISNLSRIANTSSEEFQKIAVAARTVGIEQEKLSDIYKDMNDRVGDFINTGGGPMLDFFEQIAPRIGVTADEFRRLSGPQALQLYVDSLEKANLNQQEMTFFMEAIASDSTALLPLLKDGGKALAEQAEQAEKLGLALSNIDVERLKGLSVAFSDTADVFSSFSEELSADFAPVLMALQEEFKQLVIEAGGVGTISEEVFNAIITGGKFAAEAIEGVQRTFELVGKAAAIVGIGAKETGLAIVEWFANRPIEAINELIAAYNQIPFVSGVEPVGLSQFGQDVSDMLAETRVAMEIATQDFHDTLMRPFTAGDEFENFVLKAQETSDRIAEIAANQRTNELTNRDTFNADVMAAVAEAEAWHTEYAGQQADQRALIAEQESSSRVSATNKMFSDLSSLMGSESKKMFKIGKAAAISETIISTYKGAQEAYSALAGIPVVGPALGTAAAAAAIAAGTARMQAIKSQQFGSGGGVSPVGGSSDAAGGGTVSGGQVDQRQDVFIQGIDRNSLYSGDQMVEMINIAQENGARLTIL